MQYTAEDIDSLTWTKYRNADPRVIDYIDHDQEHYLRFSRTRGR
jgi:hypothetical protein